MRPGCRGAWLRKLTGSVPVREREREREDECGKRAKGLFLDLGRVG